MVNRSSSFELDPSQFGVQVVLTDIVLAAKVRVSTDIGYSDLQDGMAIEH
jgi:hypothetical protein